MGFFRRLFGGGGGGNQAPADRNAMFVYVRPKRCDEIVRVRINLMSELSRTDYDDGYYVRKMVSAIRCPFQAEVELYFDKSRRLKRSDVENGEIVDEAAYLAQQAEAENTESDT